jgi:hypothetical protein
MAFCSICGSTFRNDFRFCPECGAPRFAFTLPQSSVWQEPGAAAAITPALYGPVPPKRIGVAILLAALFGPFGLLYSTVSGALYMLLGWCFLVLATCDDWIGDQMIASLIAWPICVVWAAFAARSFNQDRR